MPAKPAPAAAPAAAPTKESPTVSVSEAFGLPQDWSFTKSLGMQDPTKGLTPETVHTVDHAEPGEGTPAGETTETPAGETPETPPAEDGTPAGEGEPKPGEAAKPAAPAAKPAEPAKPADGKKAKPAKAKPAAPAAKPGEAAKPAAPAAKPAEPAKPADPAAPAAPAPKIKIGDKEYSEDELKAALAQQKAKPAAEPPPVAKEQTPEEKAAAEAEVRKKDAEYVTAVSGHFTSIVDENTLDTIMAGGAEGSKALTDTLRKIGAEATLLARKSIYNDIMPVFQRMRADVEPLVVKNLQSENERMENQFKEKYPDLADKMDTVMLVSGVISEKQAEQIQNMTPEQYMEHIATETKKFISKFAPAAPAGDPAAAAPAAPAAAAPAAPAAKPATPPAPGTPAPAAKPTPPKPPVVKPPGSNTPAAPGATKGAGKGSDAAIINTLW